MSVLLYLIAILVILITSIYLYLQYHYSYFKRNGIPHVRPRLLKGNFTSNFHGELKSYYNQFKDNKTAPFFGAHILTAPTLILTDLDLIKTILIKDFNYFTDRGNYTNEKDDPLSNHLFNMSAENGGWKEQRSKLSPTFTSGKMKYMFSTVKEITYNLVNVLQTEIGTNLESEIEMKDILSRFTTDVIGSVAFGIDCNSLKDPNAEFRIQGKKVVSGVTKPITRFLKTEFQTLARLFKLRTFTQELNDFFRTIVEQTIEIRATQNNQRNDFMNLLLKMKKTDENPNGFELNQIVAHAFIFFVAGFETSATTMGFTLVELAQNTDVQRKGREEVNRILKKYNEELTYEALSEMTYLECILNESLRKHSSVTFLNRLCNKDYQVPNTEFIIEKNTSILIPAREIHLDSRYYPEPEKFDPDRFTPEAVQQRHAMTFLAFGDGPRNCIGLRFGRMQSKIGLALLLKNFEFDIGDKLEVPQKINQHSFLLQTEGGFWLKVKRNELK